MCPELVYILLIPPGDSDVAPGCSMALDQMSLALSKNQLNSLTGQHSPPILIKSKNVYTVKLRHN